MINALASLLLPIPSLRWLPSLFFSKGDGTNLRGVGQGDKSWKSVRRGKEYRGRWTLRDGSVSGAGYPR
ncbi:hypothetical protein, partial [Paenibacillus cucumis (ex Kampfer et al. 2016)]